MQDKRHLATDLHRLNAEDKTERKRRKTGSPQRRRVRKERLKLLSCFYFFLDLPLGVEGRSCEFILADELPKQVKGVSL